MEIALEQHEEKFIQEQESLLVRVRDAIRDHISSQTPIDLHAVSKNIDQLKEEIKNGSERDLPSLFYQLNLQYSLAKRLSEVGDDTPDLNEPYFGYMKLEEATENRIILLGHHSFIKDNKNFRIVDWKKAPIAKIFYQYQEGEEYEFDLRNKTIEGIVSEHCVLTIENGKLLRIERSGKTYINQENRWFRLNTTPFKLEGGEGSASRDLDFGTGLTNYKSGNVVALLDKEQYNLINQNLSDPLLIIGGAGSGKTTVALHRVAMICKRKRLFPNQILVVVPNKGLVTLSRQLLESVGLRKVRVVRDFDWFKDQCQKIISNLPRRDYELTPLSVSIIKRHASLFHVFEEYIKIKTSEVQSKLYKITGIDDIEKIFNGYGSMALVKKIERFRDQHVHDSVKRMNITDLRNELMNIRETLLDMLSNRTLMENLPQWSDGVVTQRMLNDFLLHTGRQIHDLEDSDKSYADNTLDGKEVNDGSEAQGTIDTEDYPLLLYMLSCINGEMVTDRGHLKNYRHIVLDEVQELSPVELRVFSQALTEEGTMTIAGDAAQQIDKTISFNSWEGVLGELGVSEVAPAELTVSYRSPKSIVEFSHAVLGPFAPENMPKAVREGAPVKIDQTGHHAQASLMIYEALNDLIEREPRASVAIICNKKEEAQKYFDELKDLERVRLVENADFSFRPGIDVTTVEQIRGLEFDYVIIPDADATNYIDEARSRKRLHLAATRAIHQLWVLYSQKPSALIKDFV